MSYLSKIITPFLFLSSIPFLNNNEIYYKLLHFRIIEENEGIKLDILFSTNEYKDRYLNCDTYLVRNGSVSRIAEYDYQLDGKLHNYVSKIIPYSEFDVEDMSIKNISQVDNISIQKEIKELRYYPNKKDNSHFTLLEENNDKYLSTKFIHESFDLENEEYNFSHFERFKFNGFYEYQFKEGYSFFDPRKIKLTYENGKDNDLIYDTNLYIFDTYNVFNRFPYLKDTMFKILPVTFTKEKNYYYLSFKDGIYYDPTTFEVSPYKIDGYKYDEVLYFPINKFDKLQEINFKLKINVKGYMDIDISGEFSLGFNKQIYGDCESSLYCTYINNDNIEGESIKEEINL